MKINKLNYEVYAIDYLDGTLSEEMMTEMEQFMQSHPDIADSLAMFDEIVLAPDLSVTYSGKDDLKKPVRFAILHYMNWIVPICLSVAFMVAYPYIRTIWHQETPQQQNEIKTINSPSASSEKPISKVEVSSNNYNTEEGIRHQNHIIDEKKLAENIKTPITSINHSIDEVFHSMAFEKGKKEQNESVENTEKDQLSTIFSNENTSNTENKALFLPLTSINKKTVKGKKTITKIENIEALKVNPIDLLNVKNTLEKLAKEDQPLGIAPKFKPYLTFTLTPYSIGHDLAKTTKISADNQLVRHLVIDDNNKIELQSPKQFGGTVNVHFSPCFELSSGFSITDRNLTYVPSNTDGSPVLDLEDINYKTYSVPLMATFKLPLGTSQSQSLNIQSGLAIDWMGDRNFQNITGGINNEKENTAGLLKTTDDYSKMVTTNDAMKFVPAIRFGLAYEKQLKNAGSLIFAFEYNRQMSNINNIRIWDYDLDNEMRSNNNTAYQMRFETIFASVKYTLPFRVAIK